MVVLSRNRFYLANFGVPLLFAVIVFIFFDMTNLDLVFSNLFYDPINQIFPLNENRLFEQITHKWARIIPNWTGELAILGTLLSFLWPRLKAERHAKIIAALEKIKLATLLKFLTKHRRDFLFIVFAFSVSTGCIHYLKSHTSVYCPVETTVYGGKVEKTEWYENFTLLHKAGDGRCWPGGHASGGFSMLALYFIARRYRWRHAKALLYGTMLLGFIYGTTRVFQGWHYMSHTLWSGIFVWLSTLLTALAFYGRAKLEQPVLRAEEPGARLIADASGT